MDRRELIERLAVEFRRAQLVRRQASETVMRARRVRLLTRELRTDGERSRPAEASPEPPSSPDGPDAS